MRGLEGLIKQIQKRESKMPLRHQFLTDINNGYEDVMHYKAIDRFTLRLFWWHFLAFSLYTLLIYYTRIAAIVQSPLSWRLISATEATVVIFIAYFIAILPNFLGRRMKNHYYFRLLIAALFTVYSYLFIYISGGSIEMHFHLFLVLIYIVIYADWRLSWWVVLLTSFVLIMLHFIRPEWIFYYGANPLAPLVHTIFLTVAAILSTQICNSHRNALVAQKELERQKDEFVSTASHELKTPITSQKMFIQVLKKEIQHYEDDKANQYIDKINDQVSKLSKLITDLLDVSRMQLGKLTFEKEPFNIRKLIDETAESLQVITRKHEITVHGDTPFKVIGDKNRIYQVLVNLISNAIKYSPRGGKIQVDILSVHNKVIISVKDQGIGIAEEELGNIFNRLYRAIGEDEKTFPGLGIGLYITAEIIKHHGGKVWVESEKGKGSTFFFTLPLSIEKANN